MELPWPSHRILTLLLTLTVAACGPQAPGRAPAGSAAAPAYGDIMVEGSIGDASNLIPLLASDSTSHEIAGLVFNGLIKYDKDVNIVGDLGRILGDLQGRPRDHLSPAQGGTLARRPPLHRGGCPLHLSGHDRSEDAHGLCG